MVSVSQAAQMEVSMQITNISEAKASLSSLIKMVQETDKPVIIGKAGEPVAILSAYKKDTAPRTLGGSWEGKVKISDAFDEVDKDIIDSFYNSSLFPNES
jgi:prevent-host-death family protein